MSAPATNPTVAYLAQGKIRLKKGEAPPCTVDSVYGGDIREKAVRAQQKNSWKAAGSEGSLLSGPALWGKSGMEGNVPLAITSICGGKEPGALVYSLESGSLCALLQVEGLGAEERRLWNDNRTRIRHVSVSRASGDLVFSILHENGTANIGVKLAGESGVKELTEGDSFDTAPRWRPGGGRRILFQSAGIGRNREGHFLMFGPFSIQELDAEAGEMSTLLESPKFDYLAPQALADGTLLYIRRPYSPRARLHPLRALKDILLLPFRLVYAVFQFLNFFSAAFTGRKLMSDGSKGQEMDLKQMMIWGNLVQAQRAQARGAGEEEGADLVPKSWELCRRNKDGQTKVLAGGVLAYDVNEQGGIVFTNGNAIFQLDSEGKKEKLVTESMIEQVFYVAEGRAESRPES